MLDLLQILHNCGVFSYNTLPLAVFALHCLGLIFVLIYLFLAALTAAYSLAKRKTFSWIHLSVGITGVVYVFSLGPITYSRVEFAQGYLHFSKGNISAASNYYFSAAKHDNRFESPVRGLVDLCFELGDTDSLIPKVAKLVQDRGFADPLKKMAQRFRVAGQFDKAANFLKDAYALSKQPEIGLDLICDLVQSGNFSSAHKELDCLATKLSPDMEGEYLFLKAQISMQSGKTSTAESDLLKSIQLEPYRARAFVLLSEILLRDGRTPQAISYLSQALQLRADQPDVYRLLGEYYYHSGDLVNARINLRKAIYYNNLDGRSWVLLETIKKKNPFHLLKPVKGTASIIVNQTPNSSPLVIPIGKSLLIDLVFHAALGDVKTNDIAFSLLEPYGFGVEGDITTYNITKEKDGIWEIRLKINTLSRRSSQINFGKPWIINLIACNTNTGVYCDYPIQVFVPENMESEGRILYVITEDHELTSGSGNKRSSEHVPQITPREARIDLIDKMSTAQNIASLSDPPIKWSHIVDIGSSILRLRWAHNPLWGSEWYGLWPSMKQALSRSLDQGHDVQLHIHGYNIPGNRLSRQYFDSSTHSIRFKDNISRAGKSDGIHGAWAENFKTFGSWQNSESRVGSLFQGVRLLEQELHESCPDYRVIFFRAGEYEFGRTRASITASIQAMRMNQILAGSDAYEGNPFHRDFKFYRRAGQNGYFTSAQDIQSRASSLLDIGILQIVPVPEMLGHDYLSPLSDIKHVKYNYDLCLQGEKIKNGIHILLSMYHLNNTNLRDQWDNLNPDFGEWAKMKSQFTQIRKVCPHIEFSTISDAIKIYLDEYSPDLIALRTKERKISPRQLEYDIQLLGHDIYPTEVRPHYVTAKPPSYLLGCLSSVDLTYNGTTVHTWNNVEDYLDLSFPVIDRSGYSMRVFLKNECTQ